MSTATFRYLVLLVNDDGVRASVPAMRFIEGVPLRTVVDIASKRFTRFVVLRDSDLVQVCAWRAADQSGVYLPHGQAA